jgi:RND family efflux transporter MFP subunit
VETEARTDARSATAEVTPLDQVLWSVLSGETALAPFARAWLTLLCRMVPACRRAVLVLRDADALSPVARWPEGDPGSAQLSHCAELALQERRGVVSRARDSRSAHLAFPLIVDGTDQGVVAVECDAVGDAQLREAMRQLQWSTAWIELRQRRVQATDDNSRLRQGFAALEVAATALSADNFEAAARACATDMSVRLQATRVSIGWLRRRSIHIVGLSHAVLGGVRKSDAMLGLSSVMEEAVDQGASLLYPVPEGDVLPSRSAHARLAAQGGGPHILTVPLTIHGHVTGAIVLERDEPIDQPTIDVVEAVAGLVGPVLGQLHTSERWVSTIALHIIGRTARQLFGPERYVLKLATLAIVAIALFFSTFHIDYQVSGKATVEGEVRRTIASGLDGYIASERARAGQVVHQGDVLATLDDSEMNLQRLRWIATRQQHQLELDKALASGARADVVIDSAQVAEASAEIALLDEQLARAKIVAPFDGLITNGDLSQSVGMPVQRAQVLFEIAPLDSYRVIVRVPDSDIAQVQPGNAGKLALSALPDRRFPLHIVRITPIAEQEEGDNTFHVEARLDDISPQLRPNMEGVAKLDAGRRLLIWAWTHHLIDAVRLRLWSWWP